MTARLSWLGTHARTRHDDRDDVVGRGVIDLVHDQTLWIGEARLAVDVGLPRGFALGLLVPYRVVDTAIRYLDANGAEVELTNPGIHHRDETLTGLGDPMVLASAGRAVGAWRLTGRVGVTVPLGRTYPDPFALGAQGLAHQHVQLGTGTFNPVLAAEVSRGRGAWRFGLSGLAQLSLYANGEGYQAGDRFAATVQARRQLGRRWSARGTVEALGETAERWGGVVPTDDGNRGRFDLMLGLGGGWVASPTVSFDLALKVPVITRAVGGQLEMPALIELGASWSWGAPAGPARASGDDDHGHDDHDHGHDDHDHGDDEHGDDEHGASEASDHDHGDHDHGDREHGARPLDAAGLDVVDLGPAGAAVELVPVPGKITIIDFWAPWCEPCKTLEPALIALARAHPARVAIRRLDVVDWESAAVARYLTPGGFDLPHVKVFDRDGALVLEQSGARDSLDALIAAVRAVVEAAPAAEAAPASR